MRRSTAHADAAPAGRGWPASPTSDMTGARVPAPSATVGIDAGATLTKLVRWDAETAVARLPSADEAAVRAQVAAWAPERVGLTGGGASRLAATFGDVPVHAVGEFDAWAAGAPLAAAAEGTTLPARFLLASLGTGTSVLHLGDGPVSRAGGTALGGGTVLGLGRLLLGAPDFATIAALAAAGDRRRVDLLVGDVYQDTTSPLLRELTAASFAKPGAMPRREDLAHALMGLVGENVALVCGGLARSAGVETIVFGGSTLDGNPALATVVTTITTLFGHTPVLLRDGAFCGALGAAALAAEAA